MAPGEVPLSRLGRQGALQAEQRCCQLMINCGEGQCGQVSETVYDSVRGSAVRAQQQPG
jgi:hypothetical protein